LVRSGASAFSCIGFARFASLGSRDSHHSVDAVPGRNSSPAAGRRWPPNHIRKRLEPAGPVETSLGLRMDTDPDVAGPRHHRAWSTYSRKTGWSKPPRPARLSNSPPAGPQPGSPGNLASAAADLDIAISCGDYGLHHSRRQRPHRPAAKKFS